MPEQLQRDVWLLGLGAKGVSWTIYLTISAHQDDVGFMAYVPIAEHFGKKDGMKNAVCVKRGILRDLLLKPVKYSVSRVDSNEEPKL